VIDIGATPDAQPVLANEELGSPCYAFAKWFCKNAENSCSLSAFGLSEAQ